MTLEERVLILEKRLDSMLVPYTPGRELTKVEREILEGDLRHKVCRVLEDLQDRACASPSLPGGMGLSAFTEYIRNLYPEYYTKIEKK